MYNKARPPGPKLPLASPDLQKTTMFYAWFLATQKNLDHPDLLSLLIAREVVLPSFCPGQWEFMVDPWTLNVSGELCGWNFSLWKWPNFLAARKNNSCIIPQKKHPLSNGFVPKQHGYSRNTEKKKVDNLSTDGVFKKNSMVWGCTTVLRKRKT